MLKEFKEFAFKGNLVDMAVGFILGGGFATVVKSLVDNVIMPPVGKMLAEVDFSKMKFVLQQGQPAVMDGDKVVTPEVAEVAIKHGQFIQDFVSFTLLAFVVFIVVVKVIKAMQKKEEAAPAAPPKQEVLLEEIRDLLMKQA